VQSLQQGQVVWVELVDPSGRNAKCRPAVILTGTEEILPGQQIVGVAVTTRIIDPLPTHYILLPWHPGGNVRTRLRRKCFAICDWLVTFSETDVQKTGGIVPTDVMVRIMTSIDQLSADGIP
jgi:mRNA-degrading endonuclease toxin of MazEF toxin-antitoxin module